MINSIYFAAGHLRVGRTISAEHLFQSQTLASFLKMDSETSIQNRNINWRPAYFIKQK